MHGIIIVLNPGAKLPAFTNTGPYSQWQAKLESSGK